MKLHDLRPRSGAKKNRKRVGRGISAGQGKTAGRGMKGQKARSGWGGKLYFQGGNLPLFRKLPFKRGFTNINKVEWNEVNLARLKGFKANSEVSPDTLADVGLLDDRENPLVILGQGDVKVALKVRAHKVSRGARAKIEAAGGSVEIIEREA
jgi:large subunit ribosomal protein L15